MQVEKSLKAIDDHLSDDGIFLFEAETLNAVPQVGIWNRYGLNQMAKKLSEKPLVLDTVTQRKYQKKNFALTLRLPFRKH